MADDIDQDVVPTSETLPEDASNAAADAAVRSLSNESNATAEKALPRPDGALAHSRSPSPSLKPRTNGVSNQDDSEAETIIQPSSQQTTPSKRKSADDRINGQAAQHTERDEDIRGRKSLRKRKKNGRDTLFGAEDESDSSWTSDRSRDQTFKKPKLSPKTEVKSEDEFQPMAKSSSGDSMNRLRKRKQRDVTDISGNSIQNQKEQTPSSLSPRAHSNRATTSDLQSLRDVSPHRRPHRRAASIHSTTIPTIETRRSKRTTGHQDASTPSSPEPSPAQVTPHHPSNIMVARKNRDPFGDTPLAKACTRGDLNAVKTALEHNPASLNEPNNALNYPLHHASLRGHEDVVAFLLEQGCSTTVVNQDEESPLHDAVGNGHIEVVRHLLKAGLDPRQANKLGETPKDLVEAMDDGEDKDRLDELLTEAIKLAPERGHSSGTPHGQHRSNIGFRATPGGTNLRLVEYTVKALQDYAAHGNGEGVNELLGAGVIPDHNCIVAAAAAGQDFILSILLSLVEDKDPDPKLHKDNTPLLKAIGKGHLNVLTVLTSHIDPTRHTFYGNKTYIEVAKEARGPNWQDEVNMLENAIVTHKQQQEKDSKRPRNSNMIHGTPHRRDDGRKGIGSTSTSPEPRKPRRKLVTGKQYKSSSAPSSAGLTEQNDGSKMAAPVANMMRSPNNEIVSYEHTHKNGLKLKDRSHLSSTDSLTDDKSVQSERCQSDEQLKSEDATHGQEREGDHETVESRQGNLVNEQKQRDEQERKKKIADEKASQLEQEEAVARKAREQDALRIKEQAEQARKEQEAQRKEIERQQEELRKREQEAEAARLHALKQKEETERKEREAAALREEQLRKAKEEEEARKRAEVERAEQEAAERRRVEREKAEREAYLAKLPRGIVRPLQLGTSYPVKRDGLKQSELCLEDWNPVQVVQRYEVDPNCPEQYRSQFMMLNIHAAVILGETRLDFLEYPEWDRLECTAEHKKEMLPWYREFITNDCRISRLAPAELKDIGLGSANHHIWCRKEENKFREMSSDCLFWITFDDFIAQTAPDKAPRLTGFKVIQAGMCHPKRLNFMDAFQSTPQFLWEPVVVQAMERLKQDEIVRGTDLNAIFREAKAAMPQRMVYVNGRPIRQSAAPY